MPQSFLLHSFIVLLISLIFVIFIISSYIYTLKSRQSNDIPLRDVKLNTIGSLNMQTEDFKRKHRGMQITKLVFNLLLYAH